MLHEHYLFAKFRIVTIPESLVVVIYQSKSNNIHVEVKVGIHVAIFHACTKYIQINIYNLNYKLRLALKNKTVEHHARIGDAI